MGIGPTSSLEIKIYPHLLAGLERIKQLATVLCQFKFDVFGIFRIVRIFQHELPFTETFRNLDRVHAFKQFTSDFHVHIQGKVLRNRQFLFHQGNPVTGAYG